MGFIYVVMIAVYWVRVCMALLMGYYVVMVAKYWVRACIGCGGCDISWKMCFRCFVVGVIGPMRLIGWRIRLEGRYGWVVVGRDSMRSKMWFYVTLGEIIILVVHGCRGMCGHDRQYTSGTIQEAVLGSNMSCPRRL